MNEQYKPGHNIQTDCYRIIYLFIFCLLDCIYQRTHTHEQTCVSKIREPCGIFFFNLICHISYLSRDPALWVRYFDHQDGPFSGV